MVGISWVSTQERKSARSFTQPRGIVHSLTGNIYMFIIRMGIERKATPCIYFYWFGDNSISPHFYSHGLLLAPFSRSNK